MCPKGWFEGDIHNHEDGSVSIEEHVRILREAGYDFICLQYKDMEDFTRIPDPATISSPEFLVIPGSEQAFRSSRNLWAHFGFMPFAEPMPDTITDYFDIRQGLAEAEVRSPGCLKLIHHPSDMRWSMADLCEAFEGGVGYLELNPCDEPMEYALDIWDRCLTEGLDFLGTLSTDAHGLGGIRRFGYLLLKARELTLESVLASLRLGEFVAVEEGCAAVPTDVCRPTTPHMKKYKVSANHATEIRFIGGGGQVLDTQQGGKGSYSPRSEDNYVRAEVIDREGRRFFTQPVRTT